MEKIGGNMKEKQGMKWYKFLIYFALFAGAAVNILMLALSILGVVLVEDFTAALAVDSFKWAFALTIVYCVFLLGLAVMLIVTRFRLAKFKSDGLIMLYAIYFANFVLSLAYCIAASYILRESVFSFSQIINLILQAAMFQINYLYLENRRTLFK